MKEITLKDLGYDMNDIVNIPGVYIISDGLSLAIASRCEYDTPQTVSYDGPCFFVWYVRGDLMSLLNHLDKTGISHIIFQRDGGSDGIFRKYKFDSFYKHLSNQQHKLH